jgi:hypothetical protein
MTTLDINPAAIAPAWSENGCCDARPSASSGGPSTDWTEVGSGPTRSVRKLVDPAMSGSHTKDSLGQAQFSPGAR